MKLQHLLAAAMLLAALPSIATETQNTSFRLLPVSRAVAIDGRIDDWDLRAGFFACGELEHLRDQYAVWMHGMYDADNLYLLARWRDPTPLNNTETVGGHGFNGDCLQVRFILFPDTPDATASWWTLWQDSLGTSVAEGASPGERNGWRQQNLAPMPRAAELGVKQAFLVDGDGKGYAQEISIPWKLLSVAGRAPAAGDTIGFTVEPNFTAGSFGRITIKDLFNERVATPDRIFTFRAFQHWGTATLVPPGTPVEPQPVLTADGRSFPVSMQDGAPVVDWTGLIRRFEWPGFEEIAFDMPFDGYVSLALFDGQGRIVRHLLNWDNREKGSHVTRWDGLDDAVYRTPGHPVPAGAYTWKAIAHPGAKLTFRGYACYGGAAPWQGRPNDTWLGDHGVPSDVVADGERVYLACNGAEGGRHLLGTDFDGNVVWSLQNTTGMGDPEHIAAADGSVYILHTTWRPGESHAVAKADAATGAYVAWKGRSSHLLTVKDVEGAAGHDPARVVTLSGATAGGGRLFLSASDGAAAGVAMLDGETGAYLQGWPVPDPGALHYVHPGRVLAISGDSILALNPADGSMQAIVSGVANLRRVTASADGATVYASLGAPDMQVAAYDAATGRELRRYGVPGGHPRVGKWNPDGMIDPAGIAVDRMGQLWVMEHYNVPKRVSVWKLDDGSLVRDFFGPAHYGASGAAINPRDKNLMVGEGCEWRLDPATGKSECLGAFDTATHSFATYREGANGKLYLVVNQMHYGTGVIKIFERRGDADYALLATLRNDRVIEENGRKSAFTDLWIDRNGDGLEQPGEVESIPGFFGFAGSNSWSLNLGPDLAFYAYSPESHLLYALVPDGFAPNGAPAYSLAALRALPPAVADGYQNNYSCALPDCDNRVLLANLRVKDHPAGFVWHAFDMETWELLWTYPNPFFQVHGSHSAPAPDPGLFRGAYGPVGTLRTDATGPFWVINGNLGEWYCLTSSGFFLARLFSGNVFEWVWPEKPVPGVDMTRLPPGSGGEDFGGSATLAADGSLLVQAGKSAIWNLALEGLDQTVEIGRGEVVLDEADVARAHALREEALQAGAGAKRMDVRAGAVAFTGNFGNDFRNGDILSFQKSDDARVRASLAYDDELLYLGWEVRDATPWVNGAVDPAQIYACGDTVDFQIGTDRSAPADRGKPVKGDLRLSIGNLQGEPVAVLYRFVADDQARARTFSSGVVQGYRVDSVEVLRNATVQVKVGAGQYVVEATVPLATLGLNPVAGDVYRGDFGATHGTPSGDDTRLRTHWANQQTGLVDDVVFELQITPANWGDLAF